MKKFLLFAAAAAMMMSASAQSYQVTQLWKSETVPTAKLDNRQGVGMNGKIYINDKANQKVVVYGENGLINEELPGGANTGITRDEAGNIITILNGWPGNWISDGETPTVQVVNPNDPTQVKQYFIPTDLELRGRCDYIGYCKGDMMEDGELYYVGNNADAVGSLARLKITDGEVDLDNSFIATIDGVTAAGTDVPIHYFTDAAGEGALCYGIRNAQAYKLVENAQGNYTATSIGATPSFEIDGTTYSRANASLGWLLFSFDGKDFVVFNAGTAVGDYRDCWAIAEVGAEEVIFFNPPTVTTNISGFNSNCLTYEIVDDGVNIYQYAQGAYVAMYKLTKAETPAAPDFYVVGGFNAWDTNNGVKITEDGATFDVQAQDLNNNEDTNQEFKLITPSADGGWTWIGGINENPEDVNWFEITDGMLQDGTEISLYYGNDGYNFRLPAAGNYTVKLVQTAAPVGSKELYEGYKMVVTQNSVTPTAITDVNGKTVANVKYVNLAGMQSNVPFDGINIAVTTYTDGSKNVVKVVK